MRLKQTLAFVVPCAVVAATPAVAQDRCLDESCTAIALFAPAQAGGGQAAVVDPTKPNHYGTWGFDTAGMDRSVKPGDDWFQFVNGAWAKNTQIPPDRTSWGGFAILRDVSDARLHTMIERYKIDDPDADRAKVATLYKSFMDEAAVERAGAAPLKPYLDRIRRAASKDDVARLMGASLGGFGASFFAPGVSDDAKRPDVYSLYLRQSGLGLGDRELYLDPKFKPQVDRYRQYVTQLLELAGWPDASEAGSRVVDMETRIAQAHWTRAESRDRDKTYNLMTLADLEKQAPGFPWKTFWDAAGITKAERAIVAQNTAFPKIAQVFADADLDTLKAWEAFRTTDTLSPLLSKRFVDAEFDFRSKFLNGQPQQRERWKRAVAFSENAMGEAIGRDYVAQYFPPDAKAKADQLVANLRTALGQRIRNLTWMGPETKQQALEKLSHFTVKIGYPSKWRDYSAVRLERGQLVADAERVRRFEWDYRRNRINNPVDRAEWGMYPQTVNAYYNSTKNEIVFPAAILQPPFFDPDADPAVNYGGIGGVIGHEISHGFDDQGRKSDGNGVLRDWWTKEDAEKFEAQAARLGAQYEAYTFSDLPGMHINGRATMGENIGDLGGVLIALDAYHASLKGQPAKEIDGFTGDQRFFLGWGQVWRTLSRPEALRQQLVSDSHSPGQVRSVAPLRNIDAWYEVWSIKPGDNQYIAPGARVRIW
ncbi:MAG TPA: M13-type metalloendopeptidase [Vicinamibacterales bacterium]|nr:M13-type metalloendopeptidase [Vicinamibacterales bacterium]